MYSHLIFIPSKAFGVSIVRCQGVFPYQIHFPLSEIRSFCSTSRMVSFQGEFWIKDVVWPVMSEERPTVSNMWRRLEHARRGPEDGLSEAGQTHETRVRGGQHSMHTLS